MQQQTGWRHDEINCDKKTHKQNFGNEEKLETLKTWMCVCVCVCGQGGKSVKQNLINNFSIYLNRKNSLLIQLLVKKVNSLETKLLNTFQISVQDLIAQVCRYGSQIVSRTLVKPLSKSLLHLLFSSLVPPPIVFCK